MGLHKKIRFLRGCPKKASSFVFVFAAAVSLASCSLFVSRPVQLMSDTTAAIRAAKEVQADTLAPEFYRQANEWFFKAKQEYKLRNFVLATEYGKKARILAERAEFEAVRNGGIRTAVQNPSEGGPSPSPQEAPYPYPSPEGTPASDYDDRAAQEKANQNPPAPSPSPSLEQSENFPLRINRGSGSRNR